MSFRKNLEYLRKTKKLSQEDLANKLGVSRQAVSKWESGAAYPETEKILTLCKLFECSLDDLMNDDIVEIEKEKQNRYSINDLLTEIKNILSTTLEMLSTMTFRSLIRYIFEIGVLVIFLLILKIPFTHFINLGNNIYANLGSTLGSMASGTWTFMLELIYFILALITFLYIYKIRFLDKYQETVSKRVKTEQVDEVNNETEVVDNKVKVEIKDFGIFSIIGKIFLFFVKCFIAFTSLPIIFLLLCAVGGLVIAIAWLFGGPVYIGTIILLLTFISFSIAILYVMYNLIVNYRNNWRKLFIVFIISLIGLGVGSGITVLEFKDFTISTQAPISVKKELVTETIPMQDNLIINSYSPTEYIVNNDLTDSIRIEATYYDVFNNIAEINKENSSNIWIYRDVIDDVSIKEFYNILLNDLKKDRLSNYGRLSDLQVKIYGSDMNIDKIMENLQMRDEEAQLEYENM